MLSTTNDNESSTSHLPPLRSQTYSPAQQQQQQQHTTSKSSDTFVLGNRFGQSNRNDEQRYPNDYNQRSNTTNSEAQLLRHLSDDFAQLLNRTDISDCLLNVRG